MDPFPLFHLAELDFECSSTTLGNLPAYQLALAPWSTSWEDGLEATLKRTWRRRRERVRAQINAKAPMGVQVPEAERNGELFPKFELIALDFDLSKGEAALEGLTSAQLATVRFHPAATPDLVLAAEDIFFDRRERDFAAGLSLQSSASPATTAAAPSLPPSAPVVAPAAPLPPAPSPTEAPAPVAAPPAAVPAPPARPLPVPPVAPQQVAPAPAPALAPVPSTSAPTPAPGSPLAFGLPAASTSTEVAAPAPPATVQPTAETPAKPKSRLPSSVLRSAHVQPEAAVPVQPKKEDEGKDCEREREKERPVDREMTPGTRQREKEREEYKRSKSVNGRAEERGRRERIDNDVSREEPPPLSGPPAASLPSRPSVSQRSGTPPPQMPDPDADVPMAVVSSLFIVFLRHFAGVLTPADLETFIHSLPLKMPIRPCGIKVSSKPNVDRNPDQAPMVTIAFVAFRTKAEAEELSRRANDVTWNGRIIITSGGGGASGKRTSASAGSLRLNVDIFPAEQWRWRDLAPDFVRECFDREMARFAARHAGMEGRPPPPPPPGPLAARHGGPGPPAGAVGASSLSSQAEPLPQHLADALFALYTTNLPESATLAECRDFFDQCDGLVGLALTAPEHARGGMYRSVWLAFSDKQARDRAKHQLYGSRYPGSNMKLWVEHAEHASAKNGSGEMSRDFRRLHASEYQQVHGSLQPQSPQLAPANRIDQSANQQGRIFGSSVQPAAFGVPQTAFTPVPMPSYPSPAPSTILAQQQHQIEAYSPMQPGLGPLVPRPQAAFIGGSAQPTVWRQAGADAGAQSQASSSQQFGFAPSQDETASSSAKLAGINPARLAMLQAALNEREGVTSSPVNSGERLDAAEEKKLVEETTRNAWGARRSQAASDEAIEADQQHRVSDGPQEQSAAPEASAPAVSAPPPSNSPPRTLTVKGLASSALFGNGSSPPKPASPLPSAASTTSALAHIPSLSGTSTKIPLKVLSILPASTAAVTAGASRSVFDESVA
uniref:FGENESH: predicted gene_3.183 protein n=1 Tax=Rhodotorula toruloides TaxID=5286 RepID=A0A0K3CFA2_RHOTO